MAEKRLWFFASSLLLAVLARPSFGTELADVFAPIKVGRPPANAYAGLSCLENGEIRHYVYGAEYPSDRQSSALEKGKAQKYIVSEDHGFTWSLRQVPQGFWGADVRSPTSGEYVRLWGGRDGVYSIRSVGGIDGVWTIQKIHDDRFVMIKPPVFIRNGKRVVVCAHRSRTAGFGAGTFFSDDDGLTWRLSNLVHAPDHHVNWRDRHPRWQNPGAEGTVAELSDGRLWMLLRTSQDCHYECFSTDGGETWSQPRASRFHGTLTMPTFFRMRDGRLLLFWNNTIPMPELAENIRMRINPGYNPETKQPYVLAFTNRDVLHAAISEDDGETWVGFRELWLNEIRNASDLGERGGVDLSVHQSQVVEVGEGKLLVAAGQHPDARVLLLFDPDWLYEESRADDFSEGLDHWSIHKYIAKAVGHRRFNRVAGAKVVERNDARGGTAMLLRREKSPSLLVENDGATWNFPSMLKGRFETRIMPRIGGDGGRICLLDRWMNPTDPTVHLFAAFVVSFEADGSLSCGGRIEPGQWHRLVFEWDDLGDTKSGYCRLSIDDEAWSVRLPLRRTSINGLSYAHFQSTAIYQDQEGFLVDYVKAGPGS